MMKRLKAVVIIFVNELEGLRGGFDLMKISYEFDPAFRSKELEWLDRCIYINYSQFQSSVSFIERVCTFADAPIDLL